MTSLADTLADSLGFMKFSFPDSDQQMSMGWLWDCGRRLRRDDGNPIAAIMCNTWQCVAALFGAIQTGRTLISLPLPARGANAKTYSSRVQSICTSLGACSLLVENTFLPFLPELPGIDVMPFDQAITNAGTSSTHVSGAGFTLVQFSSGSTSDPKGIVLPEEKLLANIRSVLERIEPRPRDKVSSWLPLSHDMGLIGMLLSSCVGAGPNGSRGSQLTLLTPASFVQRPLRWLELCSETDTTITGGPDFALAMVARTPSRTISLGTLRVCIVGAEPIKANTLRRFGEAFSSSGFATRAFCPAYGLAEATLAVTMTDPNDTWREVVKRSPIGDQIRPAVREERSFVSTGRPLSGFSVAIADDGEILVKGPSVVDSYTNGAPRLDPEGWLHTSDLGFLDNEELCVIGRKDDVFVVAGRQIHALDVELVVANVPGVRPGRVAGVATAVGRVSVVVELEAGSVDNHTAVRSCAREISRAVTNELGVRPDSVLVAPRGTLPMTANGKVQRLALRDAILSGDFESLNGSLSAARDG